MSKLLRKAICLGLVIVMLFTMTATTFAASNSPYVEGNPENIVITFEQLQGSTYEVKIRNDRENAIGNWSLSFKTNFGLSNPEGISWSVSKNNIYTFTDPETGSIASGDTFSFTVESDKKKNSEIHNVSLTYVDIDTVEAPEVLLDVSDLEYHASEDGDFYFLSVKKENLNGTLTHPESVATFEYSIEDKNGEILKTGEIIVSEQWKIGGIGFGSGYNLLRLSAKTVAGEDVNKEYIILNEVSDNMQNLDIDVSIDSDGDSLPDYYEKMLGLDPASIDSDGDDLPDDVEFFVSEISPLDKDGDSDGVFDAEEDSDSDQLSNIEEYRIGTNLSDADTDRDGLSDSDEVRKYFTDPLKEDTDSDLVSDTLEIKIGTDPLVTNNTFDCTFQYTAGENTKVVPSVEFTGLTADQVKDFYICSVTNGLLSDPQIPGYIDCAYNFSEIGDFQKATLKFEISEELFTDGFVPVIYWFNEDAQLLEKLEYQTISGNTVSAEITHFSKYIVLNSTKQDKHWDYTLLYDENVTDKYKGIDIAFVIDSSGSMVTNDASGIRKTVTKEFIDRLTENDLGAVVDFDSSAKICSEFTADHDVLYKAVEIIDSYGGTNLSAGISQALTLFKADGYDGTEKQKYIVMLTDGQGAYSTDYTTQAYDMGITIYTVGLGNGVSDSVLTAMAEGTGGAYYHADDAEQLKAIFERIADESELRKDSDNDGLCDYFEKEMMNGNLCLGTGVPLTGVNYLNSDSDNDTLLDGEEISVRKVDRRVYVVMKSNPTIKDSDGDNIMDANDRFPLVPNKAEVLVYQSKNPERVDNENNGSLPKDLKYDDQDTDYIRKMHKSMSYQIDCDEVYTISDFYGLIDLGTILASSDVKLSAREIADQFIKSSSGETYSNSKLTDAVKNHSIMENVVSQYKNFVVSTLTSNDGDLSSIEFDAKKFSEEYSNIAKAYFRHSDSFNGFGILIHDFHGFTITVTDYQLNKNGFSGNIHFHYYDNFGLDENDKEYFFLAGFRAWYDLQHDKRFKGKYVPFMTYFDFDVPFSGALE